MIRANYYLRVVAAILFGFSHPEQPSLNCNRHSCDSEDTEVRRLRMFNVVMIISNEMETSVPFFKEPSGLKRVTNNHTSQ